MSGAYYNEFDPYAAAWLRELIKAGHIADGEVDERSILEVKADDLKGFTQGHFFAGIGVWSYALRKAGWEDDRPIWTGSCPCQPFSAAGKQKGFEDERHLWPAFSKLIGECRPPTVIGEQVSAAIRLGWIDAVQRDFENQNYACGYAVLGAHSVGAPHIRQRLYWVAERGCPECGGSGYRFGDAALGECFCRVAYRKSKRCGEKGKNIGRSAQRFSDSGELIGLADSERQRELRDFGNSSCEETKVQGRRKKSPRTYETRDDSAIDGLAYPKSFGSSERQPNTGGCVKRGSAEQRTELFCGSATDGMGDSPSDRCTRERARGAAEERREPRSEYVGELSTGFKGRCGFGGLANNNNKGLEGHGRPLEEYDTEGRQEPSGLRSPRCESMRASPTNGYWGNPDWLFCRDGRWRPVESFVGEMADGLADRLGYMRIEDRYSLNPLIQKGENRTLRLKGYGNALCAETAFGFIKAYMECRK